MRSVRARFRLSVRQTLALTAVTALLLAAFRFHPALAALAAGVTALATLRHTRYVSAHASLPGSLTRFQRAKLVLGSVLVSLALLLVSLTPALVLFPAVTSAGLQTHTQIPPVYWVISVAISALLGWPVATLTKRWIWSALFLAVGFG